MKTDMKVKLISHTPEPEKLIASAAKLCYSQTPASEIMDNLTDEQVDKFLNVLMNMGHASPIEHVNFTFSVEGVSRSLTHQLVRHRHASYSQKSQRYVTEGDFDYIVPPEIANNHRAIFIYCSAMRDAQYAYDELVYELQDDGRTEKEAYEDAPILFKNAGPNCVSGPCPEGKMTCGKCEEMRSKFDGIHCQQVHEQDRPE